MMLDIAEHDTRLCLTKPQITRSKADRFVGKIIVQCVERSAMYNEQRAMCCNRACIAICKANSNSKSNLVLKYHSKSHVSPVSVNLLFLLLFHQ